MSKIICRSEKIGELTFVAMKNTGTIGQCGKPSMVSFTDGDIANLKYLKSYKIEQSDLKRKLW
jgi:hypothetical protein